MFRRARWRYQACGRGALEVHHLVKRAQGGSDFELDRLVALCPPLSRPDRCLRRAWPPDHQTTRRRTH